MDVLLRVPPLLLRDDDYRPAVEASQASDDCGVLAQSAVAVQLLKVAEHGLQVVEGGGAAGCTGDLDALPAGEVRKRVGPEPPEALLEQANLLAEVDLLLLRIGAHVEDFRFELLDGSLKR